MTDHENELVRRMELRDVRDVARIHTAAFRGFFLTFLGPAFVKELYTAIIADRSGIAFVCERDGILLGFVAGTAEPRGFYRRLLRARWLRFALASVKPLLKKPAILPRLLRAFRRAGGSEEPRTAALMSIATNPDFQSKGVGRKLVEAFIGECSQRNIAVVRLSTDARDNDAVNRFYVALGFALKKTSETPEGRLMNEYSKVLDQA